MCLCDVRTAIIAFHAGVGTFAEYSTCIKVAHTSKVLYSPLNLKCYIVAIKFCQSSDMNSRGTGQVDSNTKICILSAHFINLDVFCFLLKTHETVHAQCGQDNGYVCCPYYVHSNILHVHLSTLLAILSIMYIVH